MILRSSLLVMASLAVATLLDASVAQAAPVCGVNGAPCDDGNVCTVGDTCAQGACFPGAPAANGTSCDNQDSCPGDTCQAGVCQPANCPIGSTTSSTMQPVTGACCTTGGGCTDQVDQATCADLQGVYSGDATFCGPDTCLPPPTTTTLPPPPTTTTLPPPPTTTTLPPPATGACCYGSNCVDNVSAALCAEQYQGGYAGDETSCKTAGVCVNCGDGCVQFGEQCDDGDTGANDGCDSSCQEEPCFDCQTLTPTGVFGFCDGPSLCEPAPGPTCAQCGNDQLENGEDCDDGNTANGDCCNANCKYDTQGTSCADGIYCNGDEVCNGAGTCLFSEVGRNCSGLSGQCSEGYCDEELKACAADTASFNGQSCEQDADCTIPGSGTCQDGNCIGAGTTLAASCRWIILGATPGGSVKLRTGEFSTVDANICGDVGRSGGITSGNFVVTSDMGEGIRFDASAKIDGDIVTGGSSLGVNLYAKIPGTTLESLIGGMTAAKTPAGMADTTGSHPLVAVCDDDQDSLHDAANALDLKVKTDDKGLYRLKQNSSDTFDISSAANPSIIDFSTFRLGHNSTLTLKGDPGDVLMLRVKTGRVNISTGAHIVLDGLKPENVLFYVKADTCRLSTRVEGAGTLFCPMAKKFRIGVGTKWAGSFLGGTREIRARYRAELTHVPFTGF